MARANGEAVRPCADHEVESGLKRDVKDDVSTQKFDGLQGIFLRQFPKLRGPSLGKKMLAEAIGAFTLVFGGCGAAVVDAVTHGSITHVGVAISFGLSLAIMIYALGHISGAHFNPAVTIGLTSAGRFPFKEVPAYVVSQITGATAAAALLRAIFGNVAHLGATIPSGSAGQSFGLEIVTTFFLVFVISAVATDSRAVGTMAGIAIGGTLMLDAMFAGPISGASMNPARTLGPAFASGTFDDLWVYIIGPIIGAILASITYEIVRDHSDVQCGK